MASTKTVPSAAVQAAVAEMAASISGKHREKDGLWLLGIANGGVPLAFRLAGAINRLRGRESAKAGVLDISFHRDDLGRHPVPKEFSPTLLPGDVTDADIILVDDVLFTGRTIKASLDELFDHGRPGRVELAVLVDRGGRRLPIAPDYVGLRLDAADGETINVTIDNDHPEADRVRIGRPQG